MKIKSYLAAWIAALAASSLMAAEAEVEVKTSAEASKVRAEVKRNGNNRAEYKQEARVESVVRPVNRAHHLIGLEVRNRSDERLGEIKDLVVDLPSGKVAYVALAVGGFLGLGEKLIAVPTSALNFSERSDKYLVLDATRGEIVDAPGIAQTNWPDYRNPNFDQAPFWRPKGQGAAAGSETGKGKLYTDANRSSRDRDVKVSFDRSGPSTRVTMGRIKAVDRRNVIIENAGRTETYSLCGTKIRLSDYKNGDRVTVKYHTDAEGKMVIDELTRN